MAEERIPCRTDGCENTIQPATARHNDGYCGPCYNRIASQERENYIRKNRRDVDLYAGMTDPVEMLTAIHQPRGYDPLVNYLPSSRSCEELYADLTSEQAAQMMQIAVTDLFEGEGNIAEDIARCLAAFTEHCLDFMLAEFIARKHLWPPIAFRGAGERITEELLRNLPNDALNLNRALQCLAWIGSDEVVSFFDATERKPPQWANVLNVMPERYAHEAGWEVRDGRRHQLYYDSCFAISLVPDGTDGDPAIRAMQEARDNCPWCSRRLVDMLRLALTDSRMSFLPKMGSELCVLTCDVCSCYAGGGLYSRQTESGEWRWADESRCPDYLPAASEQWGSSPWGTVSLMLSARNPRHAADQFLPTTFSQVGGPPAWIQDTEYPTCCDCARTMTFLGQLDNGAFRNCEGTYYAFLCPECHVTATTYQQT